MSNVFGVAWRTPCLGLRASPLHSPKLAAQFRLLHQTSTTWQLHSAPRQLLSLTRLISGGLSPFKSSETNLILLGSRIRSRCFQSSAADSSKPAPALPEKGVQLRDKPFSKEEIDQIFGPRSGLTLALGSRILSVLQARRLAGTLDLDLPADIRRVARPAVLDAGLEYLRKNYPLDEDAAIIARIEREEREEQEKLIRRAEELGLYKPQSGTYGAKLGEGNDPSGRSILRESLKQNEERLLAEAERNRQEWLEGEEKDREKLKQHLAKNTALQRFEESSALEVKGRADPRQRPVLAWVQKHHLRATDTDTDFSALTTGARLLPALAFTVFTLGLCYAFAMTYEAPARADRMWPSLPPAAATVFAIMGTNATVFALWRLWPPAWRLLNRYFISVPAYPRVLSLVGNVFSHQTVSHLAMNMFVLWIFGTRLHDDIGRGNFLALYMAAGVLGSFASLSTHVLKNSLFVTSLGASGAISGVVVASGLIHANEKWTIAFLPRDWQEKLSAPAWMFVAGLVTFDIVGAIVNHRMPKLDYYAHLGGSLTGAIFAYNWREKLRKERERNRGWLNRVLSG
ncbi:rhomboid protease PCP1 [Aspergillus lucknowensis]|uniref:Peptidase S54 rhomboid domain-containing protein n=1 Tax=Aspergillus lucknowensis TaxID=176173 RepID=A0ABR4M6I0_9EURO